MTNHRYQLEDDECLELLKMDEGIRNLFETGAEISIAKMREHIDEIEDYVLSNATCVDFQDVNHTDDSAYDHKIALMEYSGIYWVDAPEADTEFCISENEGRGLFSSYCP